MEQGQPGRLYDGMCVGQNQRDMQTALIWFMHKGRMGGETGLQESLINERGRGASRARQGAGTGQVASLGRGKGMAGSAAAASNGTWVGRQVPLQVPCGQSHRRCFQGGRQNLSAMGTAIAKMAWEAATVEIATAAASGARSPRQVGVGR